MGIFLKSKFSFQNTFWIILNQFWSKEFKTSFCHSHLFDLWSPIFRKTAMSTGESHTWFFQNRDFHLRIQFWTIWNRFQTKTIFVLAIFSTDDSYFFSKKRLCTQRKVIMGFLEIEIIILNMFWTILNRFRSKKSKKICP